MTTASQPTAWAAPSYDVAAQAIVSHAVSQLKAVQTAGEHVGDPADFINREIQQAYLDLERDEREQGANADGRKPA